MNSPFVECVPNFSDGRRPDVLKAIQDTISDVEGVYVMDIHSDADHNRSVITFVGHPQAVEEAAFRMIKKASELIDMENHMGEHPRIGATDVVPFVPISNITMADCVEMAHRVGERVGGKLKIPVYFYEEAALIPERKRLEIVRKGEYEGLKVEIATDPARYPDCGPAKLGSAGATVIGAREFLIAFNVNLTTDDEEIASKIARAVRQSSGGLPYVKALGMTVDGRAQVSMNLTNFRKTPLSQVVETIRGEAEHYGVEIYNSELVGLIPQEAMIDTAVWFTQMDLFSPDQILEQKMSSVVDQGEHPDFLESLAAGTPTPGGGSASAYTGAMAAGLVSMVARLTIGKKGYEKVEKEMQNILKDAEDLREELTLAVTTDSEAFIHVMDAYKRPKSDPDREQSIQAATLKAAEVPLGVARKALQVSDLALKTAELGNKNAITDAGAGANLAYAAITCAGYNVRVNLLSLEDMKVKKRLLSELNQLETSALEKIEKLKEILTERGKLF
jgi:glutamate formiminotransferase/formiminotetrahydrofolate cyclodeaminase